MCMGVCLNMCLWTECKECPGRPEERTRTAELELPMIVGHHAGVRT